MGQLTFQATLGGTVNLVGPNTANTTTFTLPAVDGTSGQSMQTNGSGTLSFSAVSLASGVTGTLPIANGGTGTTSTTFANLTTNVTGTLPIANGGTNSTATPTAGGVVYGTGTAQAVTSAGTTGYFLQSNGASAPTWVAASSGLSAATQAQMEAASSNTVAATPFNTQFHPGVAKVWLKVGALINSGTIMASYNVTSVVDSTSGVCTVTIATDFSSGEYVVVATPLYNQPNSGYDKLTIGVQRGGMDAGSFALSCTNYTNVLRDPDYYLCVAFGDQ